MDNYQHRYPASLGTLLLEGPLPWDDAVTIGMPQFTERYTLHDSFWEGFWLEAAYGEATAVIRWDTFWTEGRIAVEALVAGNAPRAEARSLVTKSLLDLRARGVRMPVRIPWVDVKKR